MFDFMRRSSPQSPTTAIRHALKEDGLFSAGGESVALSVVESRGRYAGRTVRYFRVFDPARTSTRGLNIRSYQDLSAHPSLLLRTGHVEADGSVIIDHRVPSLDAAIVPSLDEAIVPSLDEAIPVRERADRSAHSDDERFVFPGKFREDAARARRS
jgi:hypothetical protein